MLWTLLQLGTVRFHTDRVDTRQFGGELILRWLLLVSRSGGGNVGHSTRSLSTGAFLRSWGWVSVCAGRICVGLRRRWLLLRGELVRVLRRILRRILGLAGMVGIDRVRLRLLPVRVVWVLRSGRGGEAAGEAGNAGGVGGRVRGAGRRLGWRRRACGIDGLVHLGHVRGGRRRALRVLALLLPAHEKDSSGNRKSDSCDTADDTTCNSTNIG